MNNKIGKMQRIDMEKEANCEDEEKGIFLLRAPD